MDSRTRRMPRASVAALTALALVALAACSGGSSPAATKSTASAPTVSAAPTTTRPTTTTAPRISYLTGKAMPAGVDPDRPVVAVKVENDPAAYPLSGFQKADVVYEEQVEGGATRFILLFQSDDAAGVGSVRSNRPVDVDVLVQYGRPLLVCSGGNFTADAEAAGIPVLSEDGGFASVARRGDRVAPHNVYVDTGTVREEAMAKGLAPRPVPGPIFVFGPSTGTGTSTSATTTAPTATSRAGPTTVSSAAAPVATVTVGYQQPPGVYWQREAGAWKRYLRDGAEMTTEDGKAVTATNVLIQKVAPGPSAGIDPSGTDIPTWEVTGTGELTALLGDGTVVTGTWSRSSIAETTKYLDTSAVPLKLTPGQTWVQLLQNSLPVTVA